MSGLESYANGTKDTYRGHVWRRIAERLPRVRQHMGPAARRHLASQAVVLYLVGPDDFDRQRALKHGFQNHNLIAVDIEKERIEKVRQDGGVGVCGNLSDILAMWPSDLPVSVVLADFQCGLNNSMFHFHDALFKTAGLASGSVISVNILRGRDEVSNDFRSAAADVTKLVASYGVGSSKSNEKHRGVFFMTKLTWTIGLALHQAIKDAGLSHDTSLRRHVERHILKLIGTPSYYCYESSGQFFDSVSFNWFADNRKAVSGLREKANNFTDWKAKREQISEASKRVRFDYKSYVARLAQMKQDRNRLMRQPALAS